MILSDRDIQKALILIPGQLRIEPFDLNKLQPSSYDLSLSDNFWLQASVLENNADEIIDLKNPPDVGDIGIAIVAHTLVIYPQMFVLGSTVERIEIPDYLAARLEGKSSLGRLGLIIHATAGYIDPGFHGHLTLELANVSNFPIRLYAGMAIAQLTLLRMESTPEHLYGHPDLSSRYQNQGLSPVPFRPKQREISA